MSQTVPRTAKMPLAHSRERTATVAIARPVEVGLLILILGVGAWLRFAQLDLVEFKADEAVACNLALQFVKAGILPTAGLMSSVGVTNPPLFIYLLIPLFYLTTDPGVVSALIALLSLAAVAGCWWVGRKYYGALAGLIAAALFAVSPWAVIYSRKIWAQDFVPVLATATLWAVLSLVCNGRPKSSFWVVLLPLCAIQIHFSGFALTAAILLILCLTRPRIDWRFAVGGAVVAGLLMIPYLNMQRANDWKDFKQIAAQMGGQKWQIPPGMTIQPESGYPLPRRPSEAWVHLLAIQNAGEIEDVLGLSTAQRFDPKQIWRGKGNDYFEPTLTLGDWILGLQRVLFVVALCYLSWRAAQAVRSSKTFPFFSVPTERSSWILVLWVVVPLLVFVVAGLWTYLSYYAIMLPIAFVVLGAAAEKLLQHDTPAGNGRDARSTGNGRDAWATKTRGLWVITAIVVVVVGGNAIYMTDLYRFLAKHGGAQGTYGTGLGFKRQAAAHVARRAGAQELSAAGRLAQMDQLGRLEPAQLDLPFLASLSGSLSRDGSLGTNSIILVVDRNRSNFDADRVGQLSQLPHDDFGPMKIYTVDR